MAPRARARASGHAPCAASQLPTWATTGSTRMSGTTRIPAGPTPPTWPATIRCARPTDQRLLSCSLRDRRSASVWARSSARWYAWRASSSRPAQKVGAGRVEVAVVGEVEVVENRQAGFRSVELGDGDGPVELDDRGAGLGGEG